MDAKSGSPSPADSSHHRLTSLEEHSAFTEHAVDQLSAEIAELNKRVHTLASRIDSLETRLGKLLEPPTTSSEDDTASSSE